MTAQPAMHNFEFATRQKANVIRYQSSLFNNSIQQTVVEFSCTQTSSFEQSIRHCLQQKAPLQIDNELDLLNLQLVRSDLSNNSAEFDVKNNVSLGEDRPSSLPSVPALSPIAFSVLNLKPSGLSRAQKKLMQRQCRLRQTLKVSAHPLWALAVSPSRSFLATGGRDGSVQVFKLTRAGLVQEPQNNQLPAVIQSPPLREFAGHVADVTQLAFGPDDLLLSGSVDGTVRLWHPLRSAAAASFQHRGPVAGLCWGQDSVFYSADTQFVYRADLKLRKRLRVRSGLVADLAVNSQFLFVALADGQIQVRDPKTLAIVSAFPVSQKPTRVLGLTQSVSGNELIATCADRQLRAFSGWSGTALQQFKGFNVRLTNLKPIQLELGVKGQSPLREGPIVRNALDVLAMASDDNRVLLYPSFLTCQARYGQELRVARFQPVEAASETCDGYAEIKTAFQVTQMAGFSVQKQAVMGEEPEFAWGMIGVGAGGEMAFWDVQ